jgi:Glyoxalase-like domain
MMPSSGQPVGGRDGSGRVPTSLGELAVDHVLLATPDLATASRALGDCYGLRSIEGGHHPDWGTANWIVPVGNAYLELVAVVDARAAERRSFGRWVASAHPSLVQPIGWAVRTRSLDAVATRHALDVNAGSRAAPSGQLLTWRLAGVEHASAEPSLPFFIEWGNETPHPSHALAARLERLR